MNSNIKPRAGRLVSVLLILALSAAAPACRVPDLAVRLFFRNLGGYFNPSDQVARRFDRIDDTIYSYRFGFDRNLIVRTQGGLVVIDSFNEEFALNLKKELDAHFPGEPVVALVYSHYHLDHVAGGRVLKPRRVIAHAKVPEYWRLFEVDALAPTETIEGDRDLTIGGRTIRMLYMGRSHTDTLYAFYFSESRALFAPDLGFVRAIPPGGLPDFFYPGYVAALDRLLGLEFTTFIPSHFDPGTKQDLADFAGLMKESRRLTLAAMKKHGRIENPATADAYIEEVYRPLRARYGDWFGFDEMILPFLIRNFAGSYLGF